MGIHWKGWYWSWNSNTLATWCEELTHWKRPWLWERLNAGEGDDRGWDGWMASQLGLHEFEQALRVGDGQGSLVFCSPWGHTELDMTEWLRILTWCTRVFLYFSLRWHNVFEIIHIIICTNILFFITEQQLIVEINGNLLICSVAEKICIFFHQLTTVISNTTMNIQNFVGICNLILVEWHLLWS